MNHVSFSIKTKGMHHFTRRLTTVFSRFGFSERRWYGSDVQFLSHRFTVNAPQCPCLGVSVQTSQDVENFLSEQGYPFVRCSEQEAHTYACYLDRPGGMGATREEQRQRKKPAPQRTRGTRNADHGVRMLAQRISRRSFDDGKDRFDTHTGFLAAYHRSSSITFPIV